MESESRPLVVVVEEDRALHSIILETLPPRFEVLLFKEAKGALDEIQNRRADVVCSSFSAGSMSGLQLLGEVARVDSGLGAVLMAHYREYAKRNREEAQPTETFLLLLLKPYEARQLAETVQGAAERSRIKRELTRTASALKEKVS